MFKTGIFIGIFSYTVFFAGLLGFISKENVLFLTIFYLLIFILLIRKNILSIFNNLRKADYKINKLFFFLLALIALQAIINLIGALGPELAFDALWYHLTIPKIWLAGERIFYIPGGLLYYSAMPKLAEMLYIAGLAIGAETDAKLIHFFLGILTASSIYLLTSRIFNRLTAVAAAAIFYANPVVAWESTTAYVDLVRAFFEILAFWAFILWTEKKKIKWLLVSGMFLGFAITTKLLAAGSIIIFTLLIIVNILNNKNTGSIITNFIGSFKAMCISLGLFIFAALLIPVPWLLFAYFNTGNALFPFFTDIYPVNPTNISLTGFFRDVYNLFSYSADPLSPVYLAFSPLLIIFFKSFDKKAKLVLLYSFLAIIIWYFTPQTGGGRFITAYLPVISIAAGGIVYIVEKKIKRNYLLRIIIFGTIISASVICIAYRGAANLRYIPVIIGTQTKSDFFEKNLVFSFGDFYDIDGYFARTIEEKDKVLLIGFHNLYYVDFPFVHESWLTKNDKFNYIATQKTGLPDKYKNWELIYENEKTGVNLYKKTN